MSSPISFLISFIILSGCSDLSLRQPEVLVNFSGSEFNLSKEHEIAHRHAPIIKHQKKKNVSIPQSRFDFLTSFNFDGDLITSNNRERIEEDENQELGLLASIYYAVVESETHWFLTYHFYHIADYSYAFWSRLPLGIQHENDGENVTFVIQKKIGAQKEQLVLAALNKHNRSVLYAPKDSPYFSKELKRLLMVDGKPVLFIDWGSHAIEGNANYKNSILYEVIGSTELPSAWGMEKESYKYQLLSIYKEHWNRFQEGLMGDGKLFDGSFDYKAHDQRTRQYSKLPAFYDSDSVSLWLPFYVKRDSGVLPFRMGPSVSNGDELGSYFFDPARAFKSELESRGIEVHQEWSLKYVYHPYQAPVEGK